MTRLSRWERRFVKCMWPVLVLLLFGQILLTGHP